jgi:hypothetical protein
MVEPIEFINFLIKEHARRAEEHDISSLLG